MPQRRLLCSNGLPVPGRDKTMNVHFSIMLEKWADVLAGLCLLLRAAEYRCFVSLTANIKAVFWLQHLKCWFWGSNYTVSFPCCAAILLLSLLLLGGWSGGEFWFAPPDSRGCYRGAGVLAVRGICPSTRWLHILS